MTELFRQDVAALFVSAGTSEDVLIRAGERTELVPGATRKRVATLTGLLFTLSLVVVWAVAVAICLEHGSGERPV